MVALETLIAYEGGWFYFFKQSGRLRRSKMDEIIDASNPGQIELLSDVRVIVYEGELCTRDHLPIPTVVMLR